MREGPRLLGGIGDLVENHASRFIKTDAALDHIVGKTALQTELARQIVDRANPFTLNARGSRDKGLRVFLIGGCGDRRGR